MASMITNALVATKTHLINVGLYQHIFQEEIFLSSTKWSTTIFSTYPIIWMANI